MGLIDVPAPLFDLLDAWAAGQLPETARLALWAALGGGVSMAIYWAVSPQAELARTKDRVIKLRATLAAYDGELRGARRLLLDMLGTSLHQVRLVLAPAVLASFPLISLIVWLDTRYGYVVPSVVSDVEARAVPNEYHARLTSNGAGPPGPGSGGSAGTLVVSDWNGDPLARMPLSTPVPLVHKRRWWNWLMGNPAGYLPNDIALDRVEIDWPRREFISFGPPWVRTWHSVFLLTLIISSLGLKWAFRIR